MEISDPPDAMTHSRAGFSLLVSKAPEDIISIIKQTAPSLRPSERRVAEAVLADVNFAVHRPMENLHAALA